MARFVLIPGAGGSAWTWHLLVRELAGRGHEAVAVDIREDDPALGLEDYAATVLEAVDGRAETVLVAHSMGAFTAPMVTERTPVRMLVLVNPMTPVPGETPGVWWEATGQPAEREAAERAAGREATMNEDVMFFHDLPESLREAARQDGRGPSDTPFGQPCAFTRWPEVPLHVIVGRDDRLFPLAFQQRVVRERLGIEPDVMLGGHLLALSQPAELADRLETYIRHDRVGD
ncbi:alpha/beta hydrolase [Actinospica sp.]|uniref:alpha/beta fold hydrolase n=1 Tax=Actinospica sp. TaxID=1872142 RepID=UPI002C2281EC|nr:alpha/beta hydrolase [Actinospica sp.]HWG22506.1 alpha/beta hydrolase [Actinospica sp.]